MNYTLYSNDNGNPLMLKNSEKLFNLLISLRSPWRYNHCIRVSKYAEIIATTVGMTKSQIKYLRIAGLVHDIGFCAINDHILDKEAYLTKDEYEHIKLHPIIGTKILDSYGFPVDIIKAVMQHHESYNGTGYPLGLKANQICIYGRILYLAESFDTMTNDTPYKPAYSIGVTIDLIKQLSNKLFDPQLVDILLNSDDIANFYKQKDQIKYNLANIVNFKNVEEFF